MDLSFLAKIYLPPGKSEPQFADLYQAIRGYQAKEDYTGRCLLPVAPFLMDGQLENLDSIDPMERVLFDIAITDLKLVDRLSFSAAERGMFVTSPQSGPGITGNTALTNCGVELNERRGLSRVDRRVVECPVGIEVSNSEHRMARAAPKLHRAFIIFPMDWAAVSESDKNRTQSAERRADKGPTDDLGNTMDFEGQELHDFVRLAFRGKFTEQVTESTSKYVHIHDISPEVCGPISLDWTHAAVVHVNDGAREHDPRIGDLGCAADAEGAVTHICVLCGFTEAALIGLSKMLSCPWRNIIQHAKCRFSATELQRSTVARAPGGIPAPTLTCLSSPAAVGDDSAQSYLPEFMSALVADLSHASTAKLCGAALGRWWIIREVLPLLGQILCTDSGSAGMESGGGGEGGLDIGCDGSVSAEVEYGGRGDGGGQPRAADVVRDDLKYGSDALGAIPRVQGPGAERTQPHGRRGDHVDIQGAGLEGRWESAADYTSIHSRHLVILIGSNPQDRKSCGGGARARNGALGQHDEMPTVTLIWVIGCAVQVAAELKPFGTSGDDFAAISQVVFKVVATKESPYGGVALGKSRSCSKRAWTCGDAFPADEGTVQRRQFSSCRGELYEQYQLTRSTSGGRLQTLGPEGHRAWRLRHVVVERVERDGWVYCDDAGCVSLSLTVFGGPQAASPDVEVWQCILQDPMALAEKTITLYYTVRNLAETVNGLSDVIQPDIRNGPTTCAGGGVASSMRRELDNACDIYLAEKYQGSRGTTADTTTIFRGLITQGFWARRIYTNEQTAKFPAVAAVLEYAMENTSGHEDLRDLYKILWLNWEHFQSAVSLIFPAAMDDRCG
ncbi:hypothetical protein C8R43DRAFT_942620 [Mycena crocata]|nr:hypothetical protein C8R43DRAFT_942620 [Mycena crocata]